MLEKVGMIPKEPIFWGKGHKEQKTEKIDSLVSALDTAMQVDPYILPFWEKVKTDFIFALIWE